MLIPSSLGNSLLQMSSGKETSSTTCIHNVNKPGSVRIMSDVVKSIARHFQLQSSNEDSAATSHWIYLQVSVGGNGPKS
jgi:hypothetical protein